ncbi:MAG: uroporphyrinogen-III C-methyltransferase [Bacillota bacterium]
MAKGIVYLIGAGPGNPKLITVRGLECLRRADVVVYDRLGSAELLREVRPGGAEIIYAGKVAGHHTMRQEEINHLLIRKAEEGKVVARLKGGDPFVFGRGGEEAEALAERGIPFEVIPGITSAIAAPAYAGIPVTYRSCASTFAIVTGHEDPTKERSAVDWARISTGANTIVFLMGLANLQAISRRLTAHGRSPETPVALIRWGSRPDQRTVTGTLATITAEAARADLTPPVVIVVGEVVRLREKLRWFEDRPLFGHRVAVIRGWDGAGILTDLIEHLGGEAIDIRIIDGAGPSDREELDRTVRRLRDCHLVVFTSVRGVERLFSRLDLLGLDARALAGPRVVAFGSWTAAALRARGIRPDFAGEDRGLLKEILAEQRISAVVFAGAPTVACCIEMFGQDAGPLPAGVTVACLDEEAAQMAAALGLAVHVVPPEPTAAALADGLAQYFLGPARPPGAGPLPAAAFRGLRGAGQEPGRALDDTPSDLGHTCVPPRTA